MYRVLYRKWRPQVFSDVIGQPQVTVTLAAQVREDRLPHAYLFAGSRGTGKTTCAKILAKAVNCLHPVNGDPCNACEICRGIDDGTVLDVVEIDAASNNGVEDIRELCEAANFTPARAKYRVYIVDEVHMLSVAAFNALLKTLEEPPEHVKFILATTEVHKLLPTILSRCQRFDFRRIEPRDIAERLLYVAGQEGASLTEDAAMLIARIADGGMRDALSLLDRAISVDENVTVPVVTASAGLMSRERIYELCRALAAKDIACALTLLDALHKDSCDTERLLSEMVNQYRNFLILKTVRAPEDLIPTTAEELARQRQLAEALSKEEVLFGLHVLTDAADAARRTQNRRVEAEMAMIRLCQPDAAEGVDALAARVAALEREVAALRAGSPAARPAPAPQAQATPEPPITPDEPPVFAPDEPPPFASDETPPFAPDETPAAAPEELPFRQEPAAQGAFTGFANDANGAYAARFSAEETDDEPFDFDAFMAEHGGGAAKPAQPKPAPVPQEPFRPQPAPAAREPVQPARPQTAASAGPKDGMLDAKLWSRVTLEAERANKAMIGLLEHTRAEVRGDTLLLHPDNANIRYMLTGSMLEGYVAPAAQTVLGRTLQVRFADL